MLVTKPAMVMTFGALVACIGIVLLYLRKEQARNRIRLFGQDLQISTPDLVVFLAGCGIFVLPLVAPIKNDPLVAIRLPWQSGADPYNGATDAAISSEEKEPNDQIPTSNLITTETSINGSIATGQDKDFFKFKTRGQEPKTPGQVPSKIRVILRKTSPVGFTCAVVVYNEAENKITEQHAWGDDPISFVFEGTPNSDYFIMVKPFSENAHGDYQLVIKEE